MAVSAAGTDTATRRQSAMDLLQTLVSTGYEAEATQIIAGWISKGLTEYESNKEGNWRAKDTAIYLLTSVATRGGTTQVLPILITHLNSDNYVAYTYAAIAINRILFIRQNGQLLFAQADVREFASDLLGVL
ncbi:hypothetical protein EV360DRAFT_73778 [Lentinula raphanica]|nr:hypothetical protein EV360DRAFT_73778 [Lentinula raphanica]